MTAPSRPNPSSNPSHPTCPICQTPLQGLERHCQSCGNPLGSVALEAGTLLAQGRYRLDAVLGQGGFGITYLAWDSRLARGVALKELFLEGSSRLGTWVRPPASVASPAFEEAKNGFLQESQRLAQFSHPGIVRVWDSFEENGTAYLVMERLEGKTLGQWLERNPILQVPEVLHVAAQLLAALDGIHALGILHRDLKPDNIFVCADRSSEVVGDDSRDDSRDDLSKARVVLIDFGSARAFDTSRSVGLTRMVTPGYAPPEQYATRAKFGPYTDLYALAATLYQALSGEAPPSATDRLLGTELPSLYHKNPTLERSPHGQKLVQSLECALALPTDQRPQTAAEFFDELVKVDDSSIVLPTKSFWGTKPETPPRALPAEVFPPLPAVQNSRSISALPALAGLTFVLLLELLLGLVLALRPIQLEVSLVAAAVFWGIRRVWHDHGWGLVALGGMWGLFLGATLGRSPVGFGLALGVGVVILLNRKIFTK